jgi:hypothetical protein
MCSLIRGSREDRRSALGAVCSTSHAHTYPCSSQVEALRAEVSLAVEQAEARGAEARAQSAVREVAMQEAAAGLQHEVERVRVSRRVRQISVTSTEQVSCAAVSCHR